MYDWLRDLLGCVGQQAQGVNGIAVSRRLMGKEGARLSSAAEQVQLPAKAPCQTGSPGRPPVILSAIPGAPYIAPDATVSIF